MLLLRYCLTWLWAGIVPRRSAEARTA